MSKTEENQERGSGAYPKRLRYLYENYYLLSDSNNEKKNDNVIRVKANQQLSKYISKISSSLLEQPDNNKIRTITVSGAGNAIPSVVRINSTILEKFSDQGQSSSIKSTGSLKKEKISKTYIPKYAGLDEVVWDNEINILNFEISFDQGELSKEDLQKKLEELTSRPNRGNRRSNRGENDDKNDESDRRPSSRKTYTKTERPQDENKEESRSRRSQNIHSSQQRPSSRDSRRITKSDEQQNRVDKDDRRGNQDRSERNFRGNQRNDRNERDNQRNDRNDRGENFNQRERRGNNNNPGENRSGRAASAVRRGGERKNDDGRNRD